MERSTFHFVYINTVDANYEYIAHKNLHSTLFILIPWADELYTYVLLKHLHSTLFILIPIQL